LDSCLGYIATEFPNKQLQLVLLRSEPGLVVVEQLFAASQGGISDNITGLSGFLNLLNNVARLTTMF
jgi:hypothetical protein